MGRYVTVFFDKASNYNQVGGIRYLGIASTTNDCTGPFIWFGMGLASIAIQTTSKTTNFSANAYNYDCAISYSPQPTLGLGCLLPG
jgi:hypothetical protein